MANSVKLTKIFLNLHRPFVGPRFFCIDTMRVKMGDEQIEIIKAVGIHTAVFWRRLPDTEALVLVPALYRASV